MDTEEKIKSLADEIAEGGPASEQGLCRYINETPALLSLLYDIDRMPEQWIRGQDGAEWQQMALITGAWCVQEKERTKAIQTTRYKAMEECKGIVVGQTTINMAEVDLLRRIELDIDDLMERADEEE